MRAISLFSGIGGFDLGFQKAGIETVLQAEQDQHALAVLERHWPAVERVNDVRWLSPTTQCDVVMFGSPCQDLSVAGKRAGLEGERSGLFFEGTRIVRELRPRWVVWENVPGALSSNGGRDFGAVLDALADAGALDIAWRIVDAQWFGVAQRRRRLFVVADFRGESAAEVLFESEGRRGDFEAGGTPGEGITGALTTRTGVARDNRDAENGHMIVAPAITAKRGYSGSSGPSGDEARDLILGTQVASTIDTDPMRHIGRGDGADNLIADAGVRRLTPLECERLMGFPDGWTDLPQADSHRYKQLGNAVVVPVAQWIGHRLVRVDTLLRQEAEE